MSTPPKIPNPPTSEDPTPSQGDSHDWETLASTWQQGHQETMTTHALKELEDNIFTSSRKQRTAFAVELIVSTFLVLFWGYTMMNNPNWVSLSLGIGSLVVVFALMGAMVFVHRGTWEPTGLNTHAYTVLMRKRLEAQVRWFRCVMIFCVVGSVAMGLWSAWTLWMTDVYADNVWRLAFSAGCVVVILAGVFAKAHYDIRRKTKELHAFMETVAPLVGDSPGLDQ